MYNTYCFSTGTLGTRTHSQSYVQEGNKFGSMSGDARDFNNIETRAVIKFFFLPLQGKEPKEIHAILTETLACFLPGRAKDLSAPLYAQCLSCKVPVLLRALLPYVPSQLLLNVLYVDRRC